MGAEYKHRKQADITNADAGYGVNAFVTPVTSLATFAQPVLSSPELPGEAETIGTNHTYVAGKGSIAVYVPPKELEAPGEIVGGALANSLKWSPKLIIVGDGPETLGFVKKLMKDSFLLHIEDSKKCETGSGYVQFGSKCNPCTIVAGSFVSGKTGDGRKQYELTVEAFDKFFYNGAIVEQVIA
jgi:hypothetical protein